MSTFLVTLTVVVVSLVGAVAVAVQDPAQPATATTAKRRERLPAALRHGRWRPRSAPTKRLNGMAAAAPAPNATTHLAPTRTLQPVLQPVPPSSGPPPLSQQFPAPPFSQATATMPVTVPAAVEVSGLTEQWTTGPVGQSFWARLRSGVVLTMLLALVGTLLAAGVAGVIVALAVAVRSAVS